MYYKDSIYGSIEITEPVILDLLKTKAMRRLKYILQHGISGHIGISSRTTRFEHSVDTMLLIRKLSGSLKEQISALLHDVSHTALSHVTTFTISTIVKAIMRK